VALLVFGEAADGLRVVGERVRRADLDLEALR
jgi:hypothetical protein